MTQIFSILYFYVATAASPIMNPLTMEAIVTVLLLAINAVIICVLLGFFVRELFGVRQTCLEKRSNVFAVASADQTTAALTTAGGATFAHQRWCHPNGVAVAAAPKPSHDGIWKWVDNDGGMSASIEYPKLLLLIESVDGMRPGADFHLVDKKSGRYSAVQTKLRDVGGCVCESVKKTDEEGRVVVEGDVELAVVQHDHPHARHRAEDDGVAVGGDVPPAGGDAPAAAALLASERTVAELQAALQERDAALQERDAIILGNDVEITQLRAEIEHLKQAQPGGVMELWVAAKDAAPVPATVIVAHASANDAFESDTPSVHETQLVAQAGVIDAIDSDSESELDDAATARCVEMKDNPLHTKRNAIDDAAEGATTSVEMNINPLHGTRSAIAEPRLPKRPSGRVKTGRRRKLGSHLRGSLLHLESTGHISGIVARNSMKFRLEGATQRAGAAAEARSSSIQEVSSSTAALGIDGAAAIDCDEECWYYTDTDDATIKSGPYALVQLKTWRDAGHFSNEQYAVQKEDGDACVLLELLHVAGLEQDAWYYDDQELHVQGPYRIATFQKWLTLGHFHLTNTVRRGRNGAPVPLSAALASGVGASV